MTQGVGMEIFMFLELHILFFFAQERPLSKSLQRGEDAQFDQVRIFNVGMSLS